MQPLVSVMTTGNAGLLLFLAVTLSLRRAFHVSHRCSTTLRAGKIKRTGEGGELAFYALNLLMVTTRDFLQPPQ